MKNFRKNIAAVVAVAALSFVGAQSALASPVYASEAPVAEIEAVVPNLATEAGTVEKQNPVNLLSPKQDVSNLTTGADDTAFDVEIHKAAFDVEIHKIQANDKADTAGFWTTLKDWFDKISPAPQKPNFGTPWIF